MLQSKDIGWQTGLKKKAEARECKCLDLIFLLSDSKAGALNRYTHSLHLSNFIPLE